MRFLYTQWVGLLENNAWLVHAGHANAMAGLLNRRLADVPGVRVLYSVQANAVFAELPPDVLTKLRSRGWDLYDFIGGGTRFMCSWDVTGADIDRLMLDLQ